MDDPDDIIEDVPPPPPPPPPKGKKLNGTHSTDEKNIIAALIECDGDLERAAAKLGTTEKKLYERIKYNVHLKRVCVLIQTPHGGSDTEIKRTVSIGDVHIRDTPPPIVAPILLSPVQEEQGPGGELTAEKSEERRKNDLKLIADGLENLGIAPETTRKLRDLGDIKLNTGQFLISALDMAYRTSFYQCIAMFEEAEHIRKSYLRDKTLSEIDRQGWQKHYNQISAQIDRTAGRILEGTETMILLNTKPPTGHSNTSSPTRRNGRQKFQEMPTKQAKPA